MRIKLSLILSIIIMSVITSCNNDVFIDELTVDPAAVSLDWTGGEAVFTANQPLDRTYIIAYRWVNGRGKPIGDEGMTYTLDRLMGANGRDIYSDLCHIRLKLEDNHLTVKCLNNYYPDTLYMHIDLSSDYETKQTNLRILPSPGFKRGRIHYTLNQWYGHEYEDTINLMSLSNINNIPVTINPLAAGDTLATKSGTFAPWDQLLSDNIFGRKPFKVPGVNFSVATLNPVMTSDSVLYSTTPHPLKGDAIICPENVSVTVPAFSFCSVKAIIKREEAGFSYDIPAFRPDSLTNFAVDGIYWINCPISYEILTDISSLIHQ